MSGALAGRACLVTGGCGSVGLATARRFLREGARVTLADLDADRLRDAAHALGSDDLAVHVADVGDATAVRGMLDAAAARWGALDVIFSNAGNAGLIAPLAGYDEIAFDETWRVHVKAAFLLCRDGPTVMNDGGSIVITSSMAGLHGGAGAGDNIAYVTAKHGQTGVMRAAARALAPRRIRVNTLNPGPIRNDFQAAIERRLGALSGTDVTAAIDDAIPLGRHADPDEVASVALFLAAPSMSGFVTGHVHPVDGGLAS